MSTQFAALLHSATSPVLRDALDIWQAGVSAVMPRELIRRKVVLDDHQLSIDGQCQVDLSIVRRLIVVGAGKASAAMATALHHQIFQRLPRKGSPEVVGWINVPEGTFEEQLPGIRLFSARPSGMNIPTQAAIEGTQQILRLVSTASKEDVVLCLLSGGGSALLVAPQSGISLSEKQSVARHIAAAGGDIRQLNAVRRCLSQVKGGGLARACTAGRLISLILSDVLGDPLEWIASGPTVIPTAPPSSSGRATKDRQDPKTAEAASSVATTAGDTAQRGHAEQGGHAIGVESIDCRAQRSRAFSVLDELGLLQHPELQSVIHWLTHSPTVWLPESALPAIENIVLGNNSDAVDAAGVRAVELGYSYIMQSARQPEGDVLEVAQQALRSIVCLLEHQEPDCWISGGEPTVSLPEHAVGKGGRNQQLSLCVLEELVRTSWPGLQPDCELAFVSGGTDGEDGPTDAAGACFDATSVRRMRETQCIPMEYRLRADAYHFFSQVGGLMMTGPTGTNVCDLRVALRRRK